MIQGYYFAKPMPKLEYMQRLAAKMQGPAAPVQQVQPVPQVQPAQPVMQPGQPQQ